ncbi:hypothetical protein TNCV_117651 [Trichonephila clavipes]|nr:hypothetical protein TNCV_117651 [Trichonephila clavipes]
MPRHRTQINRLRPCHSPMARTFEMKMDTGVCVLNTVIPRPALPRLNRFANLSIRVSSEKKNGKSGEIGKVIEEFVYLGGQGK